MMAPRQLSLQGAVSDWYPDMDAIETDDALEILIEVPGIPREAIKVNVQDGYLVVDGE
jgi:HSP20 family molecular chaperone IbpA